MRSLKVVALAVFVNIVLIACTEESKPDVVVDFTVSKEKTLPNEELTFTDNSTGNPTTWSWVFEGGTPSVSTSQDPVVAYATPGIYSVSLTASNGEKEGTIRKEGIVTVLPDVSAAFTASSRKLKQGETVTFTDTSEGEPTSWAWTFEGGTPSESTEKNPVVTYTSGGIHKVTLKASNELSTNEIVEDNYITSIPTSGLQGYYKLDGNLLDDSGNNYHGEFMGDVFASFFASDRFGEANKAIKLAGTNGAVNIGNQVSNGARTISMWFSVETSLFIFESAEIILLGRRYRDAQQGFKVYFRSAANSTSRFALHFESIEGGSQYVGGSVVEEWEIGRWYHLAITISDTAGLSLYVDGIRGGGRSSIRSIANSDQITAIGQFGNLHDNFTRFNFRGTVDDVQFFDRALSAEEVLALYNE